MNNNEACRPDSSPMDVLERALSECGDSADRVVVVIGHSDGNGLSQYSNARSAAELIGMLLLAKSMTNGSD